MAIYAPKTKVAIASSFEGIVNDGAPECALTSINAYHEQHPKAFFKRKLTANEFNQKYRNSDAVKAFLTLRPMVEVAEDYKTVLDLLCFYPRVVKPLAEDPDNVEQYLFFMRRFEELKNSRYSKGSREKFGKGKESLFYKEREALMAEDYEAWLNTQEPFDDTLPQFRELVETQVWDGDTPVSGFYPRFATSKDEESTHFLCAIYTQVKKLDPSDVEGNKCIIPRDGIIGMETVPSRDKVEQLSVIADRLEIPKTHVWRMNDRYDPKQQEELKQAGFEHQFFLPGYATPNEIETAKNDPLVIVLERNNFAQQLGKYAKENGF